MKQCEAEDRDIDIRLTGEGLWAFVATRHDGTAIVARGSTFSCVGEDGYLHFDEIHARDYARRRFAAA